MANVRTLTIDGVTYDLQDNISGYITGMTVLSYGISTYAEALAAYQSNKVVYCRASSNANPATGSQLRLAFLAYVNNATTPTEFEFQYYRSVSTHTEAQQGDQVFVYKLDSTGTWTVTTREASVKVAVSTGLDKSYNNGVFTAKTKLNSETSLGTIGTTDNLHAVGIDSNGQLCVSVASSGGSVTSVGVSNATDGGLTISGSPITSSGTITVGHSNVLTSAQTTEAVYPIKIDKNGHISEYGSAVSIPTKTSDLTNNSGFITSSSLSDYVLKTSNLLGIAANISNETGTINIYGIDGRNVGVGIQIYGNDLSIYKIENSQTTSVFTYDADTDQVSLTKLITPTNNSDAATKKYVDDSIPTVPTISLNGSSTTSASFYAPTTAGTSGYVLTSSGSGSPTWSSAVLTDEKVKQEYDGNSSTAKAILLASNNTGTTDISSTYKNTSFSYQPSTGLLHTPNIQVGSTSSSGQIKLANISLIGEVSQGSTTITLPATTGTVALTSDIPTRGTPTSGGTALSLVNTGDMYTWNNKSQVQIVTWSEE